MTDLVGHGGREDERLPLLRHLPQDAADIGQEALVEHVVRLVQDQGFDPAQVHHAVVEQVEQATGAGDDQVNAAPDALDLARLADTTVDRQAAQRRAGNDRTHELVDLLGQFPGRGNDQGPRPAGCARSLGLHKVLDGRQGEGGSLAGSGLRQAEHITSGENRTERLLLDGGGDGETAPLDRTGDVVVESKIVKTHAYSCNRRTASPLRAAAPGAAADRWGRSIADRLKGIIVRHRGNERKKTRKAVDVSLPLEAEAHSKARGPRMNSVPGEENRETVPYRRRAPLRTGGFASLQMRVRWLYC